MKKVYIQFDGMDDDGSERTSPQIGPFEYVGIRQDTLNVIGPPGRDIAWWDNEDDCWNFDKEFVSEWNLESDWWHNIFVFAGKDDA